MPGPQGAPRAPIMSLGKLSPVSWVSSSQGKRRLTADMISPPLGDFRHTMHVGRGGDVFGDTSFLSNHGGPDGAHRAPRSFLVRKLQQVRRAGVPSRRGRVTSPPTPSPAPPAVSPIIKNAVSLPQLNQAAYDSFVGAPLAYDSSPSDSTDGHSGYGLDSGFCTISRHPRQDQTRESSEPPMLRRSDSLQSFRLELDLGPSLLSELLGVMSLSGAPSADTPASGQAPPACPPTPATRPAARGRCLNGVSSGLEPVAPGVRAQVGGGEDPKVSADVGGTPGRHGGADRGPALELATARELGAGPAQAPGGSWDSLDRQWGTPSRESRLPAVPHTVQVSSFAFADADEEDDEVKV